jgi:hypothetical protein
MRVRQGQMVSFAIDSDEDQQLDRWVWVPVRPHDTVLKLAARRRQGDEAKRIAAANGIRGVNSVFGKARKQLRVPATLLDKEGFDVLAEGPPQQVSGYAKISTVDRPQRVGLSKHDGYDPLVMVVPVRFERLRNSGGVLTTAEEVERDCVLLERMAGRGPFAGAATGPPPIIQVTTTDNSGQPVPLIPLGWQRTHDNPSGPLWRVSDPGWDKDPERDDDGFRIRQLASIQLTQVVDLNPATRLPLPARHKAKKKAK